MKLLLLYSLALSSYKSISLFFLIISYHFRLTIFPPFSSLLRSFSILSLSLTHTHTHTHPLSLFQFLSLLLPSLPPPPLCTPYLQVQRILLLRVSSSAGPYTRSLVTPCPPSRCLFRCRPQHTSRYLQFELIACDCRQGLGRVVDDKIVLN